MTTTVNVTWATRLPLDQDTIFDFAALGGAASASPGDKTVHATFTVDADDFAAAMAEALDRLAKIADGHPIAVEILTHDEQDRRDAEPRFPVLAGLAEAAAVLDVNKQRASQLQTRQGFPAPVAVLRSGPVWRVDDLERFAATWDRKPGRPRKTA